MIKIYRLLLCALLCAFLFNSCAKKDKEETTPVTPPPAPPEEVKSVNSFSFKAAKNATLLQDVDGVIIGDTVFVSTFSGTTLTSLAPVFTFTGSKLTVAGKAQVSGTTINDFSKPVTYTITAKDSTKKNFIVKITDTGLPTVFISTNGAEVDSKDNYVTGNIKIAGDISGAVLFDASTQIKGRGNSTWGMPKKPYRIKLDKKASLLGMSESKNWVLLANYADKSLMRNELAFEVSRRSGLAFTTGSRYVEVVLNGKYLGNYQLTEQVKEGKNQVNIEEQPVGTTSGDAITGGYLVELDGFADGEPVYFWTEQGMPVTVKYPDDGDINQAQKDYIYNHFKKFEQALFSGDFADPTNGYRKYFDVDSYVNYYIVSEVMGNPDAFWSTYMYKKRGDDKLYTGPVWDFDIALNNDDRLGDASGNLMYNAGHAYKIYIDRLMQDQTFRQKIRSRWNELKTQITTMPLMVDQLAKKLAISQNKNFMTWNILSQKVYREVYIGGSYSAEVQYVKNTLITRISFLDTKFNSSDYQ